jgi:hypothetical protein
MKRPGVIALTHPGLRGDLLYSLPAARYLCGQRGVRCDFHTSRRCANLADLLRWQSFVRRVVICDDYYPEHAGCGLQPWLMPVHEESYDEVIHLGLRRTPELSLPDWYCVEFGLPVGLPIRYDCPAPSPGPEGRRCVVASWAGFAQDRQADFVRRCPVPVLQVGARGEPLIDPAVVDGRGVSYLEECSYLAGSAGYVGTLSSHLALANGFAMPRVVLVNGSDDERHRVHSPACHYRTMPSGEEILRLLELS